MGPPRLRTLLLLWGFAVLAPRAGADSACWPEAKLIGSSATGFVRAYKLWTDRKDGGTAVAAADAVPTWTASGRPGAALPCDDIATFNGSCRDEYAYVALWGNPTARRVQARTQRGTPVWLQVDTRDGESGSPVLLTGREGELVNPDGAPLRVAPQDSAAPVRPAAANEAAVLAFMQQHDRETPLATLKALLRGQERVDGWLRQVRVLAFSRRPDGVWMQLSENWLRTHADLSITPEPSPVLRTGWLRHRDARSRLRAVVQTDDCD